MNKAFGKIIAGLEDARAYVNDGPHGFVVHEINVPGSDVSAIRGKMGPSQPMFAESIGFPLVHSKIVNKVIARKDQPGAARTIGQEELGRSHLEPIGHNEDKVK